MKMYLSLIVVMVLILVGCIPQSRPESTSPSNMTQPRWITVAGKSHSDVPDLYPQASTLSCWDG